MANRKYDHYEVASNIEGEEGTFYTYRSAVSLYWHIAKGYGSDTKVTLYGIDEMGEYTCIMAQ